MAQVQRYKTVTRVVMSGSCMNSFTESSFRTVPIVIIVGLIRCLLCHRQYPKDFIGLSLHVK